MIVTKLAFCPCRISLRRNWRNASSRRFWFQSKSARPIQKKKLSHSRESRAKLAIRRETTAVERMASSYEGYMAMSLKVATRQKT